MNAAGHRLGRITHLDPVGLCFGRLFSQPRFRLSPDDALDTQAVHVSLNIFDNPLDGVHSNFLVNGGRDQVGCTGQSELKNSTTSSVSLLFHPAAKFAPCSHLKALALFEDDHSSEPGQCQMVGYRCQNYDRFLAGKCGHCDATNSQCRLMSLPPLAMQFRTMSLAGPPKTRQPLALNSHLFDFYPGSSLQDLYGSDSSTPRLANITFLSQPKVGLNATRTGASQATSVSALAPLHGTVATSPAPLTTEMFGAPSFLAGNYLGSDNNELAERSDRRLSVDKRDRIAQALEKLRSETRTAFSGSWSSLRASHLLGTSEGDLVKSNEHEESSESDMHEITTTTNEANRGPRTTTTPSPTTQTSSVPTTLAGQLRTTTGQGESWLADQSSSSRLQQDPVDQIPIGSQKIPSGSMHGPLFFLGTGAMAPYCVNYYQFRVLISEWRLQRILKNNGLGSNRLAPQLSQHKGGLIKAATALQQRVANASGRDMLHLTVKLSDSSGRFFKGFSMLEEVHSLGRVMNDFAAPSPLPLSSFGDGPSAGLNEPMVELTMLLNSTRTEPQRIGETIISYYFHQIVLADRVEINYMSNISPE